MRGHGLLFEGRAAEQAPKPVDQVWAHPLETADGRWWFMAWGTSTSWDAGVAVCRCGATSPVLPSTAARKRWHREHKAEVTR